jgi:hypothetical protein
MVTMSNIFSYITTTSHILCRKPGQLQQTDQ